MKAEKTLTELYQLLLKYYRLKNSPYICNAIDTLYVTDKISGIECKKLKNHFQSQYPTENLHQEFYASPLFRKDNCSGAWFYFINDTNKGYHIRQKFIKKMILITK